MMLDMTSAPTTSAWLLLPVDTIWLATLTEKVKPEQAAATSNPQQSVAPILFWMSAGRAREDHVRGRRADDDEVDVGRREPRVRDGLHRGFLAQVGCRHALVDDVPRMDARALEDPLVGGVDHLAQFLVVENARRHDRSPAN